jgi:hypothetical protein
MASTPLTRLLLAVTALVCSVGVVDAAVGAVWDLVVVQGAVLVLLGVLVVASSVGRAHVRLRRDLVRWLERYAAEGADGRRGRASPHRGRTPGPAGPTSGDGSPTGWPVPGSTTW